MRAGNRASHWRWPCAALGLLVLGGSLALAGLPAPEGTPAAGAIPAPTPAADDWRPRAPRTAARLPTNAAVNPAVPASSPASNCTPPASPTPAPPAADGWRSRTAGSSAVVPAGHQQEVPSPPGDPAPGVRPAGPPPGRFLPDPTPAVGERPRPFAPVSALAGGAAREAPTAGQGGPELAAPAAPGENGGTLQAPRPLPPEAQPGAGAAPEADRTLLLGAARNAVRRGDYAQAIARYEEFFRRFGDDPAVRREYAGVLVSANRLRQAAEEYQRLIGRRPNDPELRVDLGDVYVTSKEYRKALAEYQRALELAPGNLDTATRLARAYTFMDDVPHALEVYDRYLARLQPGDDNVPLRFASLLIDLERPAEALAFLRKLREKRADDLELLADVVRAHSRLGDRASALTTLEEMAAKAPRELAVRQSLADTLYQSGDYELADLVYQQVLRLDPGNGPAVVGTARVAVALFQPSRACQILEGFHPDDATQRIDLLTWAEYHQLAGEYTQAKQIYLDFLCKDPADYEARLALAALDEYVVEYEKAKAEYAKIPPDVYLGRKARLGLASTLFGQRLFAQAADVSRALLAENPGDGDAMARLVRTLGKMGQVGQAVALGRAFVQNNVRNERGSESVRFGLGRLLLDAHNYLEAAREYEWLLTRPPARVPAAYYGLARATEKLNGPDKAQLLLATAVTLPGGETRNRLLLSDLFAGDFDDPRTAEMAHAALEGDAQNLAALIRLADAQQRLARADQHIEAAVKTCKDILAQSPTNVRARLALARALATAERFQDAVAEYDRLIAQDGCFTVPQREKARVLYSDHQFAASAAAYQRMEVPAADEVLHAELAGWAQRDPRARDALELILHANLSGRGLRDEVAHVAAGAPDPEVHEGLLRALADYDGRCAEREAAHLEGEAKSKKDFRNYEAVPVYKSLLVLEPGNEEGLFDLGQVYGALRQTQHEIADYGELLTVNPVDREGLIAEERASLELAPQFHLRVNQFDQRGRDGLAVIDRTRVTASAVLPWGDENEFVELGFARAHYQPHNDAALDGNIPFVRAQGKPCEPLLLFGQLNYEDYLDRLKDRPTFEAGADYDASDALHLRARAFLENVLENGETLRQDIYRDGVDVSADYRPTRTWDFGGTARFAHYSDNNSLAELYLVNNVLLTFPPKQLKLVLDADLESFAHQTTFPGPNHQDLHGVIHPYFSPRGFAYYEVRIEWTHWLSRDYFVHSNQCWYSLQYALGEDSGLATYNNFRALVNCDIRPWLSIGADAQQALSDVYKATSANGYLIVRLPCCLH
jgi:tetratricopeptide (TPR) repeat protein